MIYVKLERFQGLYSEVQTEGGKIFVVVCLFGVLIMDSESAGCELVSSPRPSVNVLRSEFP